VSASRPDGNQLFSDLSLSIGRESVGLVGRNGSGKSTLLAIAAGLMAPAAGQALREGKFAFLRQIQPSAGSAARALGAEAMFAAMARMERGEGSVEDAALADWDMAARLEEALGEVGLGELELTRDVASLSGGERTRLAIAGLLSQAPDLLLLDEPTNNLDREGRDAVRALLDGWGGGALVASHDRELLEGMDRIVHLSPVAVTVHGGGWREFAEARDAARERAERGLDQARRDVERQSRIARRREEIQARRDRGGRQRSASGSEPKILLGALKRRAEVSAGAAHNLAERQLGEARETVELARAQVEVVTPLAIALPPTGLPSGRRLLSMRDVTLDKGGRRIFGPVDLEITGPERVAICGPNGSGKTSLLRTATGDVEPTAGRVDRVGDRIAMLDQHAALLSPGDTLLGAMLGRHRGMTGQDAHAALARFGFRNREAERIAGTLSGGERLRAALALVFSGPTVPQLLVLDEPTNHLDMEAVEELERALASFDGALLVVSHDPAFLEAIGIQREIAMA